MNVKRLLEVLSKFPADTRVYISARDVYAKEVGKAITKGELTAPFQVELVPPDGQVAEPGFVVITLLTFDQLDKYIDAQIN